MTRYGLPIILAVIGAFVALTHLVMWVAGRLNPSVGLLAVVILLAAAVAWWGIEVLHPKEK